MDDGPSYHLSFFLSLLSLFSFSLYFLCSLSSPAGHRAPLPFSARRPDGQVACGVVAGRWCAGRRGVEEHGEVGECRRHGPNACSGVGGNHQKWAWLMAALAAVGRTAEPERRQRGGPFASFREDKRRRGSAACVRREERPREGAVIHVK